MLCNHLFLHLLHFYSIFHINKGQIISERSPAISYRLVYPIPRDDIAICTFHLHDFINRVSMQDKLQGKA